MAQDIWLNLPVKDLKISIAFFTALGFVRNSGPGNTDHSASFFIGEKKVVLMLFSEELFSSFTHHALADTNHATEVLFSLGADSKDQVDDIAQRVKTVGGWVYSEPKASNGFIYGCGFCDPDGHRWNVLYMDPDKLKCTLYG